MSLRTKREPPAKHAGAGTFPKCEVMLERQRHALHRAVTVVENRLGMGYPEVVEHPMFEALFVCRKDNAAGFGEKVEWLGKNFGLVPAEAGENWERWLEGEVGISHDKAKAFWAQEKAVTLVYEDERVEGPRKGAWRVGLSIEEGETRAYFRFWDRGMPEALGEDTMADAIRAFGERFKADGIYQVGSNYRVEIDWELVYAMDSYPIKRFPGAGTNR